MPTRHTRGARTRQSRGRTELLVHWRRILSHPVPAVLSLLVRLYLALVWFRFGLGKIETGWLTSNPLHTLVELVADGHSNAWIGAYQPLARWILQTGLDGILSVAFPVTELAIAGALATGFLARPTALLAIFINLNLVLCGLSPWQFDGRFIVLQLLLLAVGGAASRYGVRSLAPLARRAFRLPPAARPTVYMAAKAPARKHVVIVGGGFAGLEAARALCDAPVDVTVIDRTNHHLFQPLLYQVATAMLPPSDIAVPIRAALRRQRNATVLLAEVTGIRTHDRVVELNGGRQLTYDFLIVAAGARHSYFGRDEWEARAPGLKSLDDALEIRRRFLLAFERAEMTGDEVARAAEQTIVVIGGGPTGVEFAGMIPEVARKTLARDFRRADTRRTRVVLIEGGTRLLSALDPRLSARAHADLEALGVEVRTGARVTRITDDAVYVDDECIPTRTVLWAAGNAASPLGRLLGASLDRTGRVQVGSDLSVPDHPEVFVVGDLAAATSRGAPVPAVATAAIQMGRAAARNVLATLAGEPRAPFVYTDKGSLAIIGRQKAVAQIGRLRIGGPVAFRLWALVHLLYLVGFRNRISVLGQWTYSYLTHERGARLITGTTSGGVRPLALAAMEAERPTGQAA